MTTISDVMTSYTIILTVFVQINKVRSKVGGFKSQCYDVFLEDRKAGNYQILFELREKSNTEDDETINNYQKVLKRIKKTHF